MWNRITTFLLLGYLCMGRSFAYWGIPSLHLFVGELVLVLFIWLGPSAGQSRWLWVAMKQPVFRQFRKAFLIFLIFGIFQVLRGVASGSPFLLTLRDLALNYYPLYFFLGLWTGLGQPEYLPNFFRLAAWMNGIYGTLFIFVFSRVPWSFAGFSENTLPVPIFGQPSFSGLILLGLLSLEKDLRRNWFLLALNAFVLLGMLIRAEWLAFGLGLIVWAWATRNLRRVALGGAMIVVLLFLMYLTSFTYAGPETRGGTISATDMIGRVIAPINSDLAADYTADVEMYEGNVVWRTTFWIAIWNSSHENLLRALFGHGYGYALNELVPYLEDEATRTPHNFFFYTLAYTGWVGFLIFALFQLEIVRLLWSVRETSKQSFGLVFWVAMIAFALFTPFFETPQGAIPFYLLAGCICAGLFPSRGVAEMEYGSLPLPAIQGAR